MKMMCGSYSPVMRIGVNPSAGMQRNPSTGSGITSRNRNVVDRLVDPDAEERLTRREWEYWASTQVDKEKDRKLFKFMDERFTWIDKFKGDPNINNHDTNVKLWKYGSLLFLAAAIARVVIFGW